MPLHDSRTRGSWEVDIYDTPAELDPAEPVGQLALVLDPLTLYVFTASGYQVLGAGEAAPASTPASEAGQGVVELATEAEVQAGTAGVLVATAARLQAELDRRGAIAATETALGPVELATEAEVEGGTAGTLVATVARLKAELDRRGAVAATEAALGPVELATATETQAGADNERAVHPAGLKSELDRRILPGPCIVSRTGIQAVIDSTVTPIDWQSELYDPDDLHSDATNPSRITVSGFSGTRAFRLTAYILWEGHATGVRRLWLYKNGIQIAREVVTPVAIDGSTCPRSMTTEIQAVSGDYFEVLVWQNRGGPLNVEPISRFSVAPIPE